MPDIIYVKTDRVACSGELDDHPVVYYTVQKTCYVTCNYCDLKYAFENDSDD